MRREHKALRILLLFSLLVLSIGAACSSNVARDDDPGEETAQTAQQADEEEVVEADDSASAPAESSDEEGEGASQKTTGILMSIGYLAMTIGMTILPLLMM